MKRVKENDQYRFICVKNKVKYKGLHILSPLDTLLCFAPAVQLYHLAPVANFILHVKNPPALRSN